MQLDRTIQRPRDHQKMALLSKSCIDVRRAVTIEQGSVMKKSKLDTPLWRDRPNYVPPLMKKLVLRPGALVMLAIPSRMGSKLYYPEGT